MPERKRSSSQALTKLARERLRRGVTQKELSEATGLSVRTIQEMERGINENPGIRQLVAIAAAFGLDWKEGIGAIAEPEWLTGQKVQLINRPLEELGEVEPVEQRPGRFEFGDEQ